MRRIGTGDKIRALGAMSGTSLDGVDAAVIETDGETVFGFGESAYRPYSEAERAVLRHVAAHGGRVGGLDTAPFILARAGLLDHHRVALHWESVPAFRREFPGLRINRRAFESDASRQTGAGGITGIVLAASFGKTMDRTKLIFFGASLRTLEK